MMRPEKAAYLVQKTIDRCLLNESFSHLKFVKSELIQLLKIAIVDEYPHECDNYYGDDRSIDTLMYISDRWRCTGRIKWLLIICDEQITEPKRALESRDKHIAELENEVVKANMKLIDCALDITELESKLKDNEGMKDE